MDVGGTSNQPRTVGSRTFEYKKQDDSARPGMKINLGSTEIKPEIISIESSIS